MKPTMIQTALRLRRSQHTALKKMARELSIPIASLIRTAVDFALDDFTRNRFPFRPNPKDTTPHGH